MTSKSVKILNPTLTFWAKDGKKFHFKSSNQIKKRMKQKQYRNGKRDKIKVI